MPGCLWWGRMLRCATVVLPAPNIRVVPFTKRYRAGFAAGVPLSIGKGAAAPKVGHLRRDAPTGRSRAACFGGDACSAALRYQLMRAVPGVCPCGVNLRSISRAAALAAWVCSQHQTFEWSHSQSAIALVLPQASLNRSGRALPRRKSGTSAMRPYQLITLVRRSAPVGTHRQPGGPGGRSVDCRRLPAGRDPGPARVN